MTLFPSPVPAPGYDGPPPEISREIYGMPAFATILVTDLAASVSWFVDGLGFIVLFSIPGPDGVPVLVHLRRWQFQDILLRPSSSSVSAGSNLSLSFAAVVGELDDLAARARAHGGGEVSGPTDTAWNTRDLMTTCPDGCVVNFTAARPPTQHDATFTARMAEWNRDQAQS